MTETKLPGMVFNKIDTKKTYNALVEKGEIGENDLCLVEDEDNISLGVTGASVGDIIKVKAVDADGKPTAWEAAEITLKYRQIIDFTVTEQADTFSFTNDGLGFDMSNVSEIMFIIERPDDGTLGAFISFGGVSVNGFVFSNMEKDIRIARVIYKLTSPMECESILYKNSDYWWGTNATGRHLWHMTSTMPERISSINVENWGAFPIDTTIKCFVR